MIDTKVKAQYGQTGQGQYPVDNRTYNLLQVLTSKLESVEAYQKYMKDADDQTQAFFQELIQQDTQHVHRLMEMLQKSFKH